MWKKEKLTKAEIQELIIPGASKLSKSSKHLKWSDFHDNKQLRLLNLKPKQPSEKLMSLFLSAGWLYWLCRIHRSHQPDAERRDQPEAQVVFQTVWPGRQREDRQGRTGDHLLGNNHINRKSSGTINETQNRWTRAILGLQSLYQLWSCTRLKQTGWRSLEEQQLHWAPQSLNSSFRHCRRRCTIKISIRLRVITESHVNTQTWNTS